MFVASDTMQCNKKISIEILNINPFILTYLYSVMLHIQLVLVHYISNFVFLPYLLGRFLFHFILYYIIVCYLTVPLIF